MNKLGTSGSGQQHFLSGFTPSGKLHIGNYFGAMKPLKEILDNGNTIYIFVPDFHALTSVADSKQLKENIKNAMLDMLALGFEGGNCVTYRQSDIPEVTELTWYLINATSVALLQRGHAYKDKIAKGLKPNVGLFTYPVLMAADILLFKPDVVLVGADQKQHIEFSRDIAQAFNRLYKTDYFDLPECMILEDVAVIPGTDGNKMSKSYGNTIPMFGSEKATVKACNRVLTDARAIDEPKPDYEDMTIYKLLKLFLTRDELEDIEKSFINGGTGYGEYKKLLAEKVNTYFRKYRKDRIQIEEEGKYEERFSVNNDKLREIARKKIAEVKDIIGL